MSAWSATAVLPALLCSSLVAQAPGLRLFQLAGGTTQVVDLQGNIAHSWPGTGFLTAHVESAGTLVRARQTNQLAVPGQTGSIERVSFVGVPLWIYAVDGPFKYAHHDIEPMPNGNVLVMAWNRYGLSSAIAAGRDPALLAGTDWLPDSILEIQATGPTAGTVVWEWRMTDHLIQDFDANKANYGVVANHPELLDINYPPTLISDGDWNHFNGLDYDPINDWIVVSSLFQTEIYLIDHSTSTAEAAGHTGGNRGRGGDLLFRWGNPEAYRAGTVLDKQLGGQHDPRFIPPGYPGAGNITMFNNALVPSQSAAFEIALPLDASGNIVLDPVTGRYGPVGPLWSYTDPAFYSAIMSSVERLPNGNTLITSATQSRIFEVDSAGQVVWDHVPTTPGFIFQSHYLERSLWADTAELPLAGGQVQFDHLTGSSFANQFYMLLGSISGPTPGTQVGSVVLPLNFDYLTYAMATQFNTGIFVNTRGTLGSSGEGSSALVVPSGYVPAGLLGLEMEFAQLVFDGSLQALRSGNTVKVTITP